MTVSPFLFPFLCLFIAQGCICQLKQCYNPSGVAYPDFPCDPTANVSACCGQNYTCTTNFYCTSPTDHGVVGSCTDQTWQDAACPLPLNIGHNYFDYTLNTTSCADGTFCPWPNNQTCCFDHQGHSLISYHYDAPMPTTAAALSTFYVENGYQFAPTTSSLSNSLLTTSLSSSLPAFPSTSAPTSPSSSLPVSPSTSAPTSTYVGTPPPGRNSPSPLGTGIKAGIGIGVVGFLAIAGMFLLLLRRVRRHRRDYTRHSGALGATGMAPPDPRQWEKPELVGEDARKEMEARPWRGAELPGEEARTEIGAGDLRQMTFRELPG